jgi:hypothetical protein
MTEFHYRPLTPLIHLTHGLLLLTASVILPLTSRGLKWPFSWLAALVSLNLPGAESVRDVDSSSSNIEMLKRGNYTQ